MAYHTKDTAPLLSTPEVYPTPRPWVEQNAIIRYNLRTVAARNKMINPVRLEYLGRNYPIRLSLVPGSFCLLDGGGEVDLIHTKSSSLTIGFVFSAGSWSPGSLSPRIGRRQRSEMPSMVAT